MGMDRKNDIFAESNLSKPKNLPDVIVIPDLLTPGIRAKTWNKPINKTDFIKPLPSIISNVTAKEENDINKIKPLLIDQITSRDRWRECIN